MTRLYINGMLADLGADADGLLLFTYAAGDLDNPAVVQNAYTKEVVLPPTNRNARIFGNAERPDKVAGADDAFNTLARTPFVLKGESGEVLESGYVKLEESSETDGYTLHLFGGLGSFLYGLMYGEDGSKKSLASLTWGATIDAGLSFNINATRVAAAWDFLDNWADWDVINSPHAVVNFAPMHNGRPTDFDCGKGMIPTGTAHGCPIPAGSGQSGKNGHALVEFGREFNEWEVRDLRSYLQRPVFYMRALLQALADERNNGGYTFDWSAIADKWYTYTWLTLPMLDTSGVTQAEETLTLFFDGTAVTDWYDGEVLGITMAEALTTAGKIQASIEFTPKIAYDGEQPYGATLGTGADGTYLFFRLLAYDTDGNVVARSKVRCLCADERNRPKDIMTAARHLLHTSQTLEGGVYNLRLGAITADNLEAQSQLWMTPGVTDMATDAVSLSLEGYGIDHFGLVTEGVSYEGGRWRTFVYVWGQPTEISEDLVRLDTDGGTITNASGSAVYDAASRVRSGSYITKDVLLDGTPSPAELLLGLVKTFGLVLAYDGVTRTIRVLERGGFYTGETIDLTARIDRSRPVRVVPNGISEKWLEFAHGTPQGAKAEAYAKKYGAQYGSQKVNTGSPYNADTLQVLEGVPFVAGLTGLAYGRYYWVMRDTGIGTGILPTPYLDNNCKYFLWDLTDTAVEHPVAACDENLSLTQLNDDMWQMGYDYAFRLQLAGEDDAAANGGANILLMLESFGAERVHITDDTSAMLQANNGKPCWIPCLGASETTRVPHFCTYAFSEDYGGRILRSLDFGMPRELDMPEVNYPEERTIYARCWQAYIRDRYSENAHRVTARVDLRGMQVGQALLGNFFYFDGCVWVLEKITDWCWDMQEPCECVFVRVLDKGAYTNGQN